MTTALTPLRDFPDFLSPMVVKELRQGLRTRAFSSTMLLMHVLLILITLITGLSENSLSMHWMLDGMATLVLCLIMPFRVFNALSEEVKMNTLDMLMLTRITCTRILFGKWASVALQSLLITFSLMPYIVARYVFGGMDLVLELNFLVMKWLIGIVISALLVMLSTIRQAWLKNLIIVVPLFFSFFGVVNLMFSSFTGSSVISFSDPGNMWLYVVGALLSALWCIYAFLSLAASRISPPAAPLAWQKRSVHVLTILLLLGISLFTREDGWVAAAMAVLAFLTVDVMTEPLNDVPSAYVPFYKCGSLSRPLLLFSPGWASGFALTAIMASLVGLCFYLVVSAADLPYYCLACCTVWMMTSLIQILPFTRNAEDLLPIFLGTFVLVYMLIAMFSGIGVMVAKATGEQPWFLVAIPAAAMIGADQMPAGAEREKFIWVSMLCAAV
ncbi:MAG: hypothetical protein NTV80_22445, partial [Verrucomicrobia bacterium]|nr:hypothetical protein [Verrucomicrobiota bacterium]